METTEPIILAKTTKQPARLPTEIVLLILIHLDHHTLLAATATCRQWYFLAKDYRQYIWRHLALRDFSFTAARGLWKLDFLKDKDLRSCFPPPRRPTPQRRPRHLQHDNNSNKKSYLIPAASYLQPSSALSSTILATTASVTPPLPSLCRSRDTNRTGSELAPICASCWDNLQKETENTGMQRNIPKELDTPLKEGSGVVDQSLLDLENFERISAIPPTGQAIALQEGEHTEGAQEPRSMDNNTRIPSLLSYGNCVSCQQSLDWKGKRRANDESSSSQEFDKGDLRHKEDNSQEEQDWKALYQMTSNWYRGRAKGYCPLMLPSLTTLASATRALSDCSGLGLGLDSGSNPGTRNVSGTATGAKTAEGGDTCQPTPCTPAQAAIQRLLKKRKPVAVIGLQHEGSSLTAVSLAKIPVEVALDELPSESSRVQLMRSNPHYREKRGIVTHSTNHLDSSVGTHTASTSDAKPPNPNIMMQDPRRHENVSFAIRTASPTPTTANEDGGISEAGLPTGLGAGIQLPHQQQSSISNNQSLQTPVQPTLSDLANDILCHYSSPLHQFLVTGHMDGIVRLWDLSIQEPGRQCIRYWQTGPRRRVLCVGMNSCVVVCGNVDSTICVWDIHPSPGSSSSTHGTIHTASYMTSRAPHGLDDWISGIEHVCVGDSLVACSTEFSGSVLVFSLGTGTLVYEIPGLYQPSKMCMTDFFLLTGGRGAWNQGGTHRRLNQLGQGHHHHHHQQQQHHLQGEFGVQGHQIHGGHLGGPHYGQDTDMLRHPQQHGLSAMETDEYMSCCVNVWDLRTGNRLYSLIPRLPMRHLQQSKDISSILNNPQSQAQREQDQKRSKKQTIRTTSYSPMISMTQRAGRWTMPPPLSATSTSHHQLDGFDDTTGDGGGLAFSGRNSRSITNTGRATYTSLSPLSPPQPISAPLTLLDIAVTPDHSTLVVTLCERSGEGLEGVYCWDFGGSRLEGYHEEAPDVSTMIMDQNDLEYRTVANTVLADDHDEDDDGFLDDYDLIDNESNHNNHGGRSIDDDSDDDRYSNDRIHNNMVMQQVDSTALREMHQARVTGKLWIGWKLDERQFLRRKEGAMARAKAAVASQKLANRHHQQAFVDSIGATTSMEQLSV
ncbi:MAG: hypothetical protein J3R72DRAFT_237558 [Linnemannia gamsii]|nr:MAG: hypothetical protein J3R72DRAFT_237558 [Linnemannia gamsii]